MKSVIDYYNNNAVVFVENTVNADMSNAQEHFEKYLKPGQSILDLGCGSGRDSKSFIDKGYTVTAVDGSEEICKIASAYIGQKVEHLSFEEIHCNEEFDGIWACASLLHEEKDKLPGVMKNLCKALKPGGTFYSSFKYGDFVGDKNLRYFVDMNEDSFQELIKDIDGVQIIETWITGDVRDNRENEKWLNIIMKKM